MQRDGRNDNFKQFLHLIDVNNDCKQGKQPCCVKTILIGKLVAKINIKQIGGVYLQSLNSESSQSQCIDIYNSQLASITGIIRQFSDTTLWRFSMLP